MLPTRRFITEFENVLIADINTKTKRECILYLFNDFIIVTLKLQGDRQALYAFTELDDNSTVYSKSDLKYFNKIVKIVGKQHVFILMCEDSQKQASIVNLT